MSIGTRWRCCLLAARCAQGLGCHPRRRTGCGGFSMRFLPGACNTSSTHGARGKAFASSRAGSPLLSPPGAWLGDPVAMQGLNTLACAAGAFANSSAGSPLLSPSGVWLGSPVAVLQSVYAGKPTATLLQLSEPHYDAGKRSLTLHVRTHACSAHRMHCTCPGTGQVSMSAYYGAR